MGKNSDVTWKQDHPSTLLSNAVQRANRAVKQAMSHPEQQLIEQAYQSLSHAEHALDNAVQYEEHMDTVQQNQQQLEVLKQQLQHTTEQQ
ncbi:hypothetical protein ACFP56_15980 [Paenibacillus septentrionalis]|uniref:DUF2564 family protein n=1 Tax=Paenibacillus septentrionalis TaxID=429342 RepID=A0ABW1V8N1_9BACL|nr:hypothetical protein [Escherichia coli]